MKKKLIFEVEDGGCDCKTCPFSVWDEVKGHICGDPNELLNCTDYDLSTLKLIGEDDQSPII